MLLEMGRGIRNGEFPDTAEGEKIRNRAGESAPDLGTHITMTLLGRDWKGVKN